MKPIGDLLILFDEEQMVPPGRLGNTAWKARQGAPCIRTQPATSEWKGFPLQTNSSPGWEILALGECRLQQKQNIQQDDADLTRTIAGQIGSFLIFGWNSIQKEWHAWTDRFGTLHAYYAWDGKRAALGTFSPSVASAASRKTLDWEALAGWFSFGFFPADRTQFTDLHILRPASHYVFDRNGALLHQERYWEWCHRPDARRIYDDTVAEFEEVFRQVMQDALHGGRIAVPVSGGLDSRSTVAAISPELAHEGGIWSYSYGYSDDSVETRIARQVTEARGLPFCSYTIRSYLFEEIERLLAYTEGFQDVTQARQMFVRDEIASHADMLIAALWGDVWLDDMGLAGQTMIGEAGIVEHTLRKMRKRDNWLLAHVVSPQLGLNTAEPLLREFARAELQKLEHIAEPDMRVKAYKTEQWSFRWSIPPTRVFQSAAWPRKIFYDTRLADFFASVPSEFVSGRRLQIDHLKRFAPDLARVPWQVYNANLYHYQYFNTWLLPKRIAKKALRLARGKKVLARNWEVQFLGPGGRAGLEHWLARKGLRLHEFIAPMALNTLIEDFFRQPSPEFAYPISMLLTFSAWLEMYG